MKRAAKRMLTLCLLCFVLTSLLPITASAVSAEPPSLVILVKNPPNDLSIDLLDDSAQKESTFRRVGWQGYYIVYHDFKGNGIYNLRVTTQGKSFDYQTSQSLKQYCSIFTLNLSTHELTPGTAPSHTAWLVLVSLTLTLVTEGTVFWLFGYRKKRSWLVLLFVNLATQGLLSVLLYGNGNISPHSFYGLFFAEIPVFLIEMIILPNLITERSKRYTILFAFVGNVVSFIAGCLIFYIVPV